MVMIWRFLIMVLLGWYAHELSIGEKRYESQAEKRAARYARSSLDYFLSPVYTQSMSTQLLSRDTAAVLRKTLHRHGKIIVQ
jgi:hypothetical protein